MGTQYIHTADMAHPADVISSATMQLALYFIPFKSVHSHATVACCCF